MRILPGRLLAQFGAVCFVTIFSAAQASADNVKVFLLGGQSNMVGTGVSTSGLPTSPTNLQNPQNDVLFHYNNSGLTTLRPGSGNSFGPEITFGRTIADAFPDEHFALLKYAQGGSDIDTDWDPNINNNVYSDFRASITNGLVEILNAGHTIEIVGMLWTQGERDARIGRTTPQYEADFSEFIGDIRANYGTDLPFFFNRLSTGQTDLPAPGLTAIRTAQENVAAADPNIYMIDADDMSFHDQLHFDAAGQIALGEAFGASYISSVPEPSSLLLLGMASLLMARCRHC